MVSISKRYSLERKAQAGAQLEIPYLILELDGWL